MMPFDLTEALLRRAEAPHDDMSADAEQLERVMLASIKLTDEE